MKNLDLPLEDLPRIAVAGQFILADSGFSTIHRGRTHALHLHGYTGEMELAGQRIRITPGDITLSPAGLVSSYDLAAPGTHWCIHIEAGEGQGTCAPIALHLPGCAVLRERFAHISGLFATASDPIAHIAARLAAQDLLLTLARRTDPLPEDDAAARAAEYIDRRARHRRRGGSRARLARAAVPQPFRYHGPAPPAPAARRTCALPARIDRPAELARRRTLGKAGFAKKPNQTPLTGC